MASRIAARFRLLASQNKRAIIPFFTAGHPTRESTVPVMHALAGSGADVIELGVPFSDPMADGPAIQRSSEKALALGVGLTDVLGWVAEFRTRDVTTPVVLMGYANPIERMGSAAFIEQAANAGVDGVIVVDYPPEESAEFAQSARSHGIDPIFLLAPTTGTARIDQILSVASGYVYYVSLRGITGGTLDINDVVSRVSMIKSRTELPVGVGFGIRDAETARAVAQVADAVIIGTRMIQLLEEGDAHGAPDRVAAFIASVRSAMDATVSG
jgi:tryptophan synthase alpha chain